MLFTQFINLGLGFFAFNNQFLDINRTDTFEYFAGQFFANEWFQTAAAGFDNHVFSNLEYLVGKSFFDNCDFFFAVFVNLFDFL